MYKVGIITASDKGSRGEREDLSAQVIKEEVAKIDGQVLEYVVIPDEYDQIYDKLVAFADEKKLDLVLTTGGTGFSMRDVTPEATIAASDRLVPGIPEIMRLEGYKITPRAVLSRAAAGIRKQTLIINLPGSPKAVRENLTLILPILPHGLDILIGSASECAR